MILRGRFEVYLRWILSMRCVIASVSRHHTQILVQHTESSWKHSTNSCR